MEISNELMILSSLVHNNEYSRKVLAHLKDEYFQDDTHRVVFTTIRDHIQKYQSAPSKLEVGVNLRNNEQINEKQTENALGLLAEVFAVEPSRSQSWLMETTEKWCKNQAVFNAIQTSINIYQGEDTKLTTNAIPDLLKEAIGVCFDDRVGMDFFEDAEQRFEYYTNPENKIPFHLNILNDVTCGGITKKTLNLLVSGSNVGKTLGLIDFTAGYVRNGLNVLYISSEMREEEILKRIDANMLKVPINDVAALGKDRYLGRIETLKRKSYGKLRVKEYPPGSVTASHIRNLVDEIKLKSDIVFDIIAVDYLQITGSSRIKYGSVGSYYYYKAVAEELRALAVELDVAVWSAAQFNRGGMNATEVGMEDVAESVGIMHTTDGAWGLIRTEELDSVGQLMWKQLKSRYANRAVRTRFVTGVDIEKQTFYDVSQSEQDGILNPEKPLQRNQSDITSKLKTDDKPLNRFGTMSFD